MLVGRQHGDSDQDSPGIDQPTPVARGMRGETVPDDDQQCDMQRGRLVIRLIEAGQGIEPQAEEPIDRRFVKTVLQREQYETGHSYQLCRQQSQCMPIHLTACAAQQKRQAVQQVDRPVGHDGPGPKWNLVLPAEHDAGRDLAIRSQLVGPSIADEEQRAEQREPGEAAPPLNDISLFAVHWVHAATRRARPTVKMPHSSMRCSIFSKPASRTS